MVGLEKILVTKAERDNLSGGRSRPAPTRAYLEMVGDKFGARRGFNVLRRTKGNALFVD